MAIEAAGMDLLWVMTPRLNNQQRRYLGLREVLPHWQAEEWLPNTFFYHDETAIRKIVWFCPRGFAGPDAFTERDYDIELTVDGLMRTGTGKGKPRRITETNIGLYWSSGCEFYYNGSTHFQATAPRYRFVSIKGNGVFPSWDAVSGWLDGFIAQQPPSLPQEWANLLAAPVPTIAYRPGDIVAFTLSNGAGYGFCRVLLDVNKLRETPWVQDPPRYTGGFHYLNRIVAPLVLAEVFKIQKETPSLTPQEIQQAQRYPPLLLTDTGICNGCLPIVAHQAVEAAHLGQLPEAFELLYQGAPYGHHYQWGVVSVIVPQDETLEAIENAAYKQFAGRIRPLADFDEEGFFLFPETHFQFEVGADEVRPHELRHSHHHSLRALIMDRLGLPVDISYDDFSRHFGYPTRQELLEIQAGLPFNRRKWGKW